MSKLTSISINGTMQENDYTYDNNNNITNIDNIAQMLSNGLGGTYSNGYFYDNINRLSTSTGVWTNNGITLNYSLDMGYSNNGRITNKILTANVLKNGSISNVAYANTYSYNSQQPNTLLSVNGSGQYNNFGWDANGNMIAHVEQSQNGNIRTLCWDEENRLMSVADNNYTSYYVYDNGGERTYKLTGTAQQMNINGNSFYYSTLDNPTLYTSGYLVANRQGYTKHYYNGSERVASSIGMGGLNVINTPLTLKTYHGDWNDKINSLKSQMVRVLTDCQHREIYCNSDLTDLYHLQQTLAGQIAVYYYHPDHLGSSSWITDASGVAIQHLHYLPFGEDWVDQRNSSWNAPYTFSGKEKDAETGYGYFGARYYDSGLSIWLSVDPMSDKYPNQSSYLYCSNNPVTRIDPDGMTDYDVNGKIHTINDGNTNLKIYVSQRQFNRLERKYNRSLNRYNHYKEKMMEKNGYSTTNSSTYTTPFGEELPCVGITFHRPKGRGGFMFIDDNNNITSLSDKTNHDVKTINGNGTFEILKSWASTLLEMFGQKKSKPKEDQENSPKPTLPKIEEYQYKSRIILSKETDKYGRVIYGHSSAPTIDDSIRITNKFKDNDKRYGSKTQWK